MTGVSTVTFLAESAAYAVGVGVVLLCTMPFFVSITRLRANYLPKAVSLTNVLNEGELDTIEHRSVLRSLLMRAKRATAKIGPVVDGVFPMIARTKRLEGWRGLYQGSTIVASGVFVTYTIGIVFFLSSVTTIDDTMARPRTPFVWAVVSELLQALVVLPFDVVLKRTMVHPRRLNWFRPRESLREVLSPAELRRPWLLFRLPGLLPAMLLRVSLVSTLSLAADRALLPRYEPLVPSDPAQDDFEGPSSTTTKATVFGFAAYLIVILLLQLLAVPLECIVVRLSVQRPVAQQPLHVAYAQNASVPAPSAHSHQASVGAAPEAPQEGAEEATQGAQEAAQGPQEADAELAASDEEVAQPILSDGTPRMRVPPPRTKSPTSEPVIALRPCEETLDEIDSYYGATPVEPYTSVTDCFRKMVAEEGYESLYRGLPFSMGLAFL
ncbi:hypothetical protein MBRA1_002272 [Malassezia brasiliensis]|uniref:Mitochondrial carrier n=1 Tax=Malassezia brasiliensis TaxID=1821822 RepID=A0AAF0DVM7_9BASI|nr:hypothetical protein MBRA1_002272 [Malassezia brasiliensis]